MREAIGLFVMLAWAAGGCGEDAGIRLLVDVRTDLAPGVEFAAVEVELRGAGADRNASAPALASHDFVAGRRVAELDGLHAGDVTVHVALVDTTGASVAQRSVELTLDGDTGVTVVIARDCAGVRCPGAGDAPTETQCHGGLCVDARCHTGHADTCGTVECGSDAMCANGDPCTLGTCAAGACLFTSVPSCALDAGLLDAGSLDAGPLDAGPRWRDSGPPDGGPPRSCSVDSDCLAAELCRDGRCASSCPERWVATYTGTPCSSDLFSCVAMCEDEACQNACFMAEPMPAECFVCVNAYIAACYNAAGCGAAWSCFAVCAEARCPDGAFSPCGETNCHAELEAWRTCYMSLPMGSCGPEALRCAP